MVDTLPDEVEYEIDTLGSACTAAAQRWSTCDLGDMAPGESFTFDIYALVDPVDRRAARPSSTRRAPGRWTATTPDPNEDNNCDTRENLVLHKHDLRIEKYGKPDGLVEAGEELEYTIIVDNLGPSYAEGVSIKDVLSSSGEFTVTGFQSDRPATCAPDNPPTGMHDRQYLFDCTLTAPLEVLEATGEPVNPGRWIMTYTLTAEDPQDVDNTVDGDRRRLRSGHVQQLRPGGAQLHGRGRPVDHQDRQRRPGGRRRDAGLHAGRGQRRPVAWRATSRCSTRCRWA